MAPNLSPAKVEKERGRIITFLSIFLPKDGSAIIVIGKKLSATCVKINGFINVAFFHCRGLSDP